jgi:MFS family permease
MSTQTASHELATLQPVQRRLLWTLGLGAFGLAFSITTISVALPPLLHTFTTSGSLIGLVIGAEGFFALTLSPIVGPWSDSFHTPLGRRRPFMLVALGPMAFCLLLIPFMPNLWTTTLLVLAFYFAYYLYEPPYRGLYPDVLPPSAYGRAQGVQHVLRGIALGVALVGGNFLL